MVHGEFICLELLAAVVAGAFVELVFPPWRAFEFSGFVALFADSFRGFGIGVDFEIGFSRHLL